MTPSTIKRHSFAVMTCSLAAFQTIALAQAGKGNTTNPFRDAYMNQQSVARADLLACRATAGARPQVKIGGSLTTKEMGGVLHGTWVRELTWNGVPVDTESGYYFDIHGDKFTAMMFDQSNTGRGPLSKKVDVIKADPALLEKTPKMTFIDCDFLIVDKYYKVSDEFLFDGLGLKVDAAAPLKSAYDQLVARGFFDRRYELKDVALRGKPVEEMLTPSIGGAFWTGSLRTERANGQEGVMLQMIGEYRGAHVGDMKVSKGVKFRGVETAYFFREGDMMVSALGVGPRPPQITRRRNARPPFSSSFAAQSDDKKTEKEQDQELAKAGANSAALGGWVTDCSEFFDLPQRVIWERVVVEPASSK